MINLEGEKWKGEIMKDLKRIERIGNWKINAMRLYAHAIRHESVEHWKKKIYQYDAQIAEICARMRKKAGIALILLAMLSQAGCQTMKGVTGDAGWLLTELSDNIQVKEK